jgi:hypothetical protein
MKYLLIIIIFLLGFLFGVMVMHGISGKVNVVKIVEEERPLLAEAFRCHGIEEANINSDGLIYFIRDNRWCPVYNKGFRKQFLKQPQKESDYAKK